MMAAIINLNQSIAEQPRGSQQPATAEVKQSIATAPVPAAPPLDDIMPLTEDLSISAYTKWGGLPAALISTPDFKRVREEDADIRTMFCMLDQLERDIAAAGLQSDREIELLVAAVARTGLNARALSRLNSPLLDGLWKIVTGRDADELDDECLRPNVPLCFQVLLLRCIVPKPHASTLNFLLPLWPRLEPINKWRLLEVAAATGHVDVLKLLLRSGHLHLPYRRLLALAGSNGHGPAVDVIQSSAATAVERSEYLIVLQEGIVAAAKNGHVDIVLRLLELGQDEPHLCYAAVDGAVEGHQMGLLYRLAQMLLRVDEVVSTAAWTLRDLMLPRALYNAARDTVSSESVEFLLRHCRLNRSAISEAVYAAIAAGHVAALKCLLVRVSVPTNGGTLTPEVALSRGVVSRTSSVLDIFTMLLDFFPASHPP